MPTEFTREVVRVSARRLAKRVFEFKWSGVTIENLERFASKIRVCPDWASRVGRALRAAAKTSQANAQSGGVHTEVLSRFGSRQSAQPQLNHLPIAR